MMSSWTSEKLWTSSMATAPASAGALVGPGGGRRDEHERRARTNLPPAGEVLAHSRPQGRAQSRSTAASSAGATRDLARVKDSAATERRSRSPERRSTVTSRPLPVARGSRARLRPDRRPGPARRPDRRCGPPPPWSPATRCRTRRRRGTRPARPSRVAGRERPRAGNGPERRRLLAGDERHRRAGPGAPPGTGRPRPRRTWLTSSLEPVADVVVRRRERDGQALARVGPARGRAVEDELDRRVDAGGERQVGDLAVEDQMDIDDRRRPERARASARAGRRHPSAAETRSGVATITASTTTLRAPAAHGERPEGRAADGADRSCPAPSRRRRLASARAAMRTVKLAERDRRPADVAGVGPVEEPDAEDLRRRAPATPRPPGR